MTPYPRAAIIVILLLAGCRSTLHHCGGMFWRPDDAHQILRHADAVELEPITQTAQVECRAAAWRLLRSADDPAAEFRRLFSEAATTAAKIYALAGLRDLSESDFVRFAATLNVNETVPVTAIDFITAEPVSEVLRKIDAGELQHRWARRP